MTSIDIIYIAVSATWNDVTLTHVDLYEVMSLLTPYENSIETFWVHQRLVNLTSRRFLRSHEHVNAL